MKKSITTLSLVLTLFFTANAQKWVAMMEDPRVNFYDVQKEFYSFYVNKTLSEKIEPRMDGPYTRFKEWERFMEPRVFPTGIRPDPKVSYQEWLRQKAKARTSSSTANWTFVGPDEIPANGGGAGKVNCIALDPTNSQNIWVGTAGGGVWKSTDGGSSWNSNTDNQLPSLGIIEMAIDPVNPNNMYICLLEGIFKSTDGGTSWSLTAFHSPAYRLVIDSFNPGTLLASAADGIYRSTDGGATWTQSSTTAGVFNRFRDIEFNPANTNIVYAASFTSIFRSADNGQTWAKSDTGLQTGLFGIKLAVSPANPNYVYALTTGYGITSMGGYYGLYRSDDAGLTWTARSTTPNILGYDPTGVSDGGQGAYCMSLAVSPLNADEVYSGGINLWKSIDGGVTWTLKSEWMGQGAPYVHADQQALEFQSGSGSVLYSGNDGGINVSTDGGDNWTDLSNGLAITQFYKLSSSATDPDMIVAGAQDNGTDKLNGGLSTRINAGDGMECIVDYTDSNIVYTSYQYGALYRSNDGGATGQFISPGQSASFFAEYTMNPVNHNTLYAAYNEIYKSYDAGSNWILLTSGLYQSSSGGFGSPMLVAPSDTNVIYLGRLTNFYRSTDGGITWATIPMGISTAAIITGMAISPTDANTVWVTVSSYNSFIYTSNEKVYKSTNGGTTWTNITYSGLPAVPVNCIVYQNSSPDALYVGTEAGVYYIDNTMSSWMPYSTGLPNTRIMDLDIQYAEGKLRAATFGRGIWESDLNVPVVAAIDAGVLGIINPSATACDSTITPEVQLMNFGASVLTDATINYQVDGGVVNTYAWTGSLASFATVNVSLPSLVVSGGTHILTAYTSFPNSVSDPNIANDSTHTTFTFPVGLTLPYSEGFESATFPPTGMTITNPDLYITWARSTAAAYSGQASAYVNDMNYYNDNMIDELILPYFNLSGTNPFLTFEYAYQLRANPVPVNYYSDTLEVDVSTDCGDTWTVVYKKFDLPLVTTTPVFDETINFIPATAADWAFENIDLSPFTNSNKVLIKIKNINGRGNDLYLDDINLIDVPVGIETTAKPVVGVYPNPNNGTFTFSIQNGKAGSALRIYDVFGKMVHGSTLLSGTNPIDISGNAAGVYFYKVVVDDREVGSGKLIVK